METLEHLRAQVAKAPTSPGIYRWLNAQGDVLYIGKAKNLRARLRSYVQEKADKSLGPWKLSLRKHIADFDVTVTSNELEALVLETNLIKEVKPKYNVLMKDDKNYVYVRISKEAYPSVTVVRQMEKDDAKYFGPFLTAYNINRVLDAMHEIFNFRSCSKSIEAANRNKALERGCVDEQIGQCNGLCLGRITEKEYNDGIAHIRTFLGGNHTDAKKAVTEMMQIAATEKKFEKAAKLRDTLSYIESLQTKQNVSDTSQENTDAIGIAMQSGKVQVVVLKERGGKVSDEHTIEIRGEAETIADVLSQFVPQYYGAQTELPDRVLVQEEIEDRGVLSEWLSTMKGKKVELVIPERGKKSKLLMLATRNADEKIQQQFAKWEAQEKNIKEALQTLQDELQLTDIPKRIEGYDISHLGGTETVGSMVVMYNGKPAKKDYRSFTIRTVDAGHVDDYKSLQEVLRRRLRYVKNDEDEWKKREVILRKARKADQKNIAENREKRDLPTDDNAYKETVIAMKDDQIVGMARMQEVSKEIYEIRSVWVDESVRGNKLGHALVRTFLKKKVQGKIYVCVEQKLEEYYAQIGFRYVREAPKALVDFMKSRFDGPLTYMVHEGKDGSLDSSLITKPDLLVIDGGKGQLSSIVEVLKELDLQIPVIGLAKREEEVFVPGSSLPLDIANDSQASFLLQRLRNEAHRFANAHREKRISSAMIASALDDVSGIGEKTKKDLLMQFGSVQGVQKATDEELLQVLNEAQLQELRKTL